MSNAELPERIWINEPPDSGRVTAYISPIREVGTERSLSLAEYALVSRDTAPTWCAYNQHKPGAWFPAAFPWKWERVCAVCGFTEKPNADNSVEFRPESCGSRCDNCEPQCRCLKPTGHEGPHTDWVCVDFEGKPSTAPSEDGAPDYRQHNQEALERFRGFARNWDSYNGQPIDLRAIEVAARLISVLPEWQIVPRSDGGIQFVGPKGEEINIDAAPSAGLDEAEKQA